jgi:glucosamine--fructose-6-phosphate aminotransferase (isomerizing)
MTKLLSDIFSQPAQLQQSMVYSLSEGWPAMGEAAQLIRRTDRIYITGIGSSWHAGMAVQSAFHAAGRPAFLYDASEFLHFCEPPPGSVVIFLSRSGQSVEVVKSMAKCREAGARIIAVTNSADSDLARGSDIFLLTRVNFDHNISISTYTSLILTGQLLASSLSASFSKTGIHESIGHALSQVVLRLPRWQESLYQSDWLNRDAYTYFLARGCSMASAHESMLLWQEAAKQPASALTTGGFRHGPQEVIVRGIRVGLWIDSQAARGYDFSLLADLQQQGILTLTLGTGLPAELKGLVLDIPDIQPSFQPLVNIIPLQLAAERLAGLKGEDCDSFRFCDFIIDREGGL